MAAPAALQLLLACQHTCLEARDHLTPSWFYLLQDLEGHLVHNPAERTQNGAFRLSVAGLKQLAAQASSLEVRCQLSTPGQRPACRACTPQTKAEFGH